MAEKTPVNPVQPKTPPGERLRNIVKAPQQPAKLKDLPPQAAEDLLQSVGFPPGNGRVAQGGWSGETKVAKRDLEQLLMDAAAEAEAQQGGK